MDVVPLAKARRFGVMQADDLGRILSFLDKPSHLPAIIGEPDKAMVSMGIYVFSQAWLREALFDQPVEGMDFGLDVIPLAVAHGVWQPTPLDRPIGVMWALDALRMAQLDFLNGQPARLPRITHSSGWHLGQGSIVMPGATISQTARLSCTIVALGAHVLVV